MIASPSNAPGSPPRRDEPESELSRPSNMRSWLLRASQRVRRGVADGRRPSWMPALDKLADCGLSSSASA